MHDRRFPNETTGYREARTALLEAELALDAQVNEVARLRRALPAGGEIAEDYAFTGWSTGERRAVRLSSCFEDAETLLIYSMMFGSEATRPCPSCTSVVDALEGTAHQLPDHVALVVVAGSPIERLMAFAGERNWTRIRLLSTEGTTYSRDYFGGNAEGSQMPVMNTFDRMNGAIRHSWASEMLFVKRPGHPRHVDRIWPLWNLLDMTSGGRGQDWGPTL